MIVGPPVSGEINHIDSIGVETLMIEYQVEVEQRIDIKGGRIYLWSVHWDSRWINP